MHPEIELGDGIVLKQLGKLNVVLGKNGSGKSTVLRKFDHANSQTDACVRYVTPERGGSLKLDGNLETNQANNPDWLPSSRRNNQFGQFRQSSVSEFRRLETLVLRAIESDPSIRRTEFTFETEVNKINALLDHVKISRAENGTFEIFDKVSGDRRKPETVSSGESELISLSVEVLLFAYLCKQEKFKDQTNWLLLDEPDVHLHPDLQYRFVKLVVEAIAGTPSANILIATHSTSILSAFTDSDYDISVGFKVSNSGELEFEIVNSAIKSVLPMFGAHPLSSVFNERPILIVEGEDESRIWSQAIRSSNGRIRAYPCVAGDIQSMSDHESAAEKILSSIYENAKAYSLRDRDDDPYEINDVGPVLRARLNCRSSENLIVSDEVLTELGIDWASLQQTLEQWLVNNTNHTRHGDLTAFANGWNRMSHNLKSLRNLIIGLSGSDKPWEVAVGQAIAKLNTNANNTPNSLENYLGEKIIRMLSLKD